MTVHTLKSWDFLYQPIVDGRKTHDLRKLDRRFEVGDRLVLREYWPQDGKYTGRECMVEVTFITSAETPCALSSNALRRDHAILSIKLLATTANGVWNPDEIKVE